MTKNLTFNESHWTFILKQCETDQQRHSIKIIRDLCKASFKEYSDTRLVFYKNSENSEVVWIRLAPNESPEIVIKLPAIINDNREVSKKISKRYGFKLDVTGNLYSVNRSKSNNETYHCIYQSNDFRFEELCIFREVVIRILGEIPQDYFESLIKLIQ
jgi:hypothetical protein